MLHLLVSLLSFTLTAFQSALPEATEKAVGDIVTRALESSGTPSASIAIVIDGKVAFTQAYGKAQIDPVVAATPAMRYKIASNSKQFAATAILLLAEDKKLSLDDAVGKYLPDLTRANDITIRMLLSHTSGYSDYYPLDYVAPFMANDTTADAILNKWAKAPLDFEPGSRWQYSTTNYVAVGRIIEKVSGQPLMAFLRARILDKLGMKTAVDVTSTSWSTADPTGYLHYITGPLRPALPEGNNWMWAAGELGMTAGDLALWDISLMNGTILKPESIKELSKEVQLTGGTGTGYALGLSVSTLANGHRRWTHSGGASGFISRNTTYPDDRMAITVLTNADGAPASAIAQRIEALLLAPAADPAAAASLDRAKRLYASLVSGTADAALIDSDLAAFFTPQAVADFSASLKAAGAVTSFTESSREDRGGMVHRTFSVQTATKRFSINAYVDKDGRFSQFLISPVP
jgi:CubicO group peptidase (beta-lactamase class C family)